MSEHEPGDIDDPALGVEGDAEPLDDNDAETIEETVPEDEG